MAGPLTLGVDIGATKLAAGILDAAGGLSFFLEFPTPHTSSAGSVFDALVAAMRTVLEESAVPFPDVKYIGVACPGPIDFEKGEVSPVLIPAWRSYPLVECLQGTFRRQVLLENDAKAFAFAEAIVGTGRAAKSLLGVVVSTGVSAGIVLHKKLLHGASGNAGHLGHTIVDPAGPNCPYSTRGCLTAVASGASILRRISQSSTYRHFPSPISTDAIKDAARHGDVIAISYLRDAGTALGRSISSAAHLLDLDTAVIGGSLAADNPFLWDSLLLELNRRLCLSFTKGIKVLPSLLGPSAGTIGAALLATARFKPEENRAWTSFAP